MPKEHWNPKEQLKKIGVVVDEKHNILQDVEDPDWHWIPKDVER